MAASSSSTSGDSGFPTDVLELLQSLLDLDDAALTSFLSAQAGELVPVLLGSLSQLASSVLNLPYLSRREESIASAEPTPQAASRTLVLLLARSVTISRTESSSIASNFVAALQQPSALLDLCLVAAHLRDAAAGSAALRLLRQIATPTSTGQVTESVRTVLEEASHTSQGEQAAFERLRRAARVAASTAPLFVASGAWEGLEGLAQSVRQAYESTRPPSSKGKDTRHFPDSLLHARVELLETAAALLRAASSVSSNAASSQWSQRTATLLVAFASSTEHSSAPPYVPLADLDLLADLVLVRPSLLPDGLGGLAEKALLQARTDATSAALTLGMNVELTSPHFIGPAWSALRASSAAAAPYTDGPADDYGNAGLDSLDRNGHKGKGRADPNALPPSSHAVDPELIETVLAVLPHLADEPGGVDGLRVRLSQPVFAGMGADQAVQAILDGEGRVEPEELQTRLSNLALEEQERRPARSSGRSNIFDAQPMDLSRVRWGSDKERAAARAHAPIEDDLPSELKAAVLQRVLAQAAEEAAGEGEWDPFEDDGEVQAEVGFEEDLDNEPTGLHRRAGIALLAGSGGDARQWREDASDEDDYEDEPRGDVRPAASLPPSQPSANGAAAERAAERILIRAWAAGGEALFARDAKARKSPQRKALLAELAAAQSGAGGKVWDDHFVESWASMFARNPRKEALVNSASDLLMPNPNLAPPTNGADGQRYGPDKGRGGRVAGRGGGHTGAQGGRGGASGGRGGSTGGGAQQGHSGNNRDARRKEQRGNVARQRGFDRKAARGAAGAGGL